MGVTPLKIAIVTGGANGIGRACVEKFLTNKFTVICLDKNIDDMIVLREEILKKNEDKLLFYWRECDVSDHTQIKESIKFIVQKFKRIDCIVNNVGVHPPATSICDLDIDDFENLVNINLTSTIAMCKYSFNELKKTKGTVVNVSSMVAIHGQYLADAYCATKAGQLGFTKSFAIEAAKYGVRVNAICPSNVSTPTMTNWLNTFDNPDAKRKEMEIVQKLNRMATPEEIANLIFFLSSSQSSFMTGNIIEIAGGSNLDYPIIPPILSRL
jgi:NAD(P)-dependent dehydrogenase (short-subunit alcohol dehydrogenase family)